MNTQSDHIRARPESASGLLAGSAAVLFFAIAVPFLLAARLELYWRGLALVLGMAICMIVIEVFVNAVHWKQLAKVPRCPNWGRILRKLLALYVAWGIIYALYSLLTNRRQVFFLDFWTVAEALAPLLILIAPIYIILVDSRQLGPEDEYHHAGLALTCQWSRVDWGEVGQFFRGWAVKGFFLPLMFVFLTGNIRAIVNLYSELVVNSPPPFMVVFDFTIHLLYTLDVSLIVVGYSMTLRVFDSHIRSAEPSALGWMVCLVCYPPSWNFVKTRFLQYDDGLVWSQWLAEYPYFRAIWGVAILLLIMGYVSAGVPFGLRFSNLTHRGIITSGLFRWTKHPAFILKNTSWWLISIPFISNSGFWEAFGKCFLLGCVNYIYYLRAWTEERHLSRDPVYQAYSDWIREHGAWARVKTWIKKTSRRIRAR